MRRIVVVFPLDEFWPGRPSDEKALRAGGLVYHSIPECLGLFMTSIARRWMAVGAAFGAVGVALGAYGAHGLDEFLAGWEYGGEELAHRLDIFKTAVHYQMLHAVALVITGLALEQRSTAWWRFAAWAFTFGIVVFCGLLKVLTFAPPQWSWLGAIVPIGGIAMILGWTALGVGALRKA